MFQKARTGGGANFPFVPLTEIHHNPLVKKMSIPIVGVLGWLCIYFWVLPDPNLHNRETQSGISPADVSEYPLVNGPEGMVLMT